MGLAGRLRSALTHGDDKTKPEPWARALVSSAMGPLEKGAWLRGRWIVLLEIAMGRSQIFNCGAELLTPAAWGQGSSRVSLTPGHLEPLGNVALSTVHGRAGLNL